MYKHYVTSVSFLLEVIILLDCSTDCEHIAYSPRATSAKFRSSTKFWKSKLNTSLIFFWSNQQIHAQHLWLSELEPKPLLQLDLNLSGNVATKRPGDLWQPHHHLHQQDSRATQGEVPKLHGWQGAHIIAHQGVLVKYISDPIRLIRTKCTTAPTTRTSPLWTSSLGSPLYLVSHNTISTNDITCFPEFERLPKMTWLDFISGFGGLCGLCLGISFVSLAEILYWFSIRLCKNIWFTRTQWKTSPRQSPSLFLYR